MVMSLLWSIPVTALLASPAFATDHEFCRALDRLRVAAHTEPQRVAILKQDAMTFACEKRKGLETEKAFCNAAAKSVGIEFTHVFPWLIVDCLQAEHIKPGLETVDQYTGIAGREKVRHLWANWRDSTHLDIRFKPTADFGTDAKFKDYWGGYELVLWKP
jgi:hypothetical protein